MLLLIIGLTPLVGEVNRASINIHIDKTHDNVYTLCF